MKMMQGLTTIAAAMLLAGCASTQMNADACDPGVDAGELCGGTSASLTRRYTLTLQVSEVNGQDKLSVLNEKVAACTKFDDTDQFRRGCIVAGPDETVNIKVQFTGSKGWYFTEFQICRAADDNPQKPANFDNCTLTDDERADWVVLANSGVAIPGASGRVDINQFGKDAIRQFSLRDQNWTEANYFYRIKACSSDTNCAETDPGAQNTGRR